jgi:predicted double-glycine peptidase
MIRRGSLNKITFALLVTLAGGLFASAAWSTLKRRSVPVNEVERMLYLPIVRQATDYTCGVAATQSIVTYYGSNESEAELSAFLRPSPETGTPVERIAAFLEERGFRLDMAENRTAADLERYITAGKPVMVLLQAWVDAEPGVPVHWEDTWDSGHWVIAVGFDRAHFYFMDPYKTGQYTLIPRAEFESRWHDEDAAGKKYIHFGMAVWRDDRAPEFKALHAVPML